MPPKCVLIGPPWRLAVSLLHTLDLLHAELPGWRPPKQPQGNSITAVRRRLWTTDPRDSSGGVVPCWLWQVSACWALCGCVFCCKPFWIPLYWSGAALGLAWCFLFFFFSLFLTSQIFPCTASFVFKLRGFYSFSFSSPTLIYWVWVKWSLKTIGSSLLCVFFYSFMYHCCFVFFFNPNVYLFLNNLEKF